ncbi:hypothetical protein CDL15_Pgr022730 [Punica granatum]|nr:hypothetical protein CDL15_Pgr022730 [Punica granatum]
MMVARPNGRIPLPKRKRTRRQRGQSPFTFQIASSPSEEKVSKADRFSPSYSSDVTRGDETNEEEDMAHCLILLARGQLGDHEKRRSLVEESLVEEDDEDEQEANHDHHHDKFSSKRFLATEEYVYQCKTCNKAFPSFQALGGHRASHKKARITPPSMIEHNKQPSPTSSMPSPISALEDDDVLSLQWVNTKNSHPNTGINIAKQLPKIHQCSICGAEFSSGQALGGHMRRHRTVISRPAPALALIPRIPESEEPLRLRSKAPSLQLDLNLPAPEDDDPEVGFPINSRGQQRGSSLVFSFPALVGCHY